MGKKPTKKLLGLDPQKIDGMLDPPEDEAKLIESSNDSPRTASVASDVLTPFEQPGDAIGSYKILEKIGEGGFGIVYIAQQRSPMTRRVALKIIKPGMDSKQIIGRFEAERQALAMMDHPNIAKVLDAGTTELGRPYFVMELVKGVPITHYCDQERLSTHERLDLFISVCRAIQHAHQKGIIHRDLKPSNILVTLHDGVPVPKVIDFGIAKATQQELTDKTVYTHFQQFIGTPAYMSPEQAEMSGLDIDTRSDIYSLGVLLYELLTGTTPFDTQELIKSGPDEIRKIIREREPEKPSTRLSQILAKSKTPSKLATSHSPLATDLDWIVMKCLEKDRTRRYETANGLALDLRRHLNNETVVARPPTPAYRLQKAWRRNRLAYTAGLAVVAALLIGLAISLRQTDVAIRAQRQADAERDTARQAQAEEATQRQIAEQKVTEASQLHYFLSMQLIGQGWQSSDLTRVPKLLAGTRAYPDRGFEWRYWQRKMHGSVRTFYGHQSLVRDVAFSPDGMKMATCDSDGIVLIWDLLTQGKPLKIHHGGSAWTVAFSPKKEEGGLLVAGRPGAAIWNTATGRRLVEITPPKGISDAYVRSACFSSEGTRVVCGDTLGNVWVCDSATGHELYQMKVDHTQGQRGSVWYVAHSKNGRYIAATFQGERIVRLWGASDGTLLHEFEHDYQGTRLAFTPDEKRLVTCSWDSLARIWDTSTGEVSQIQLTGQAPPIHAIDISPDGRRIATASHDQTVMIWDMQTGERLNGLRGHTADLRSVRYSPVAPTLASTSWDNAVKLWDETLNQEHGSLTLKSEVDAFAVLPDGSVVIFSKGNTSSEPDLVDSVFLKTVQYEHADQINVTAVSHDGEWIVTGGPDRIVRIWDAITGEKKRFETEPLSDDVTAIAVMHDKKSVVAGCRDGSMRIIDMASGETIGFSLNTNVGAIAVDPHGQWFVVACDDKTVTIRDTQTGELLRNLPWDGTSEKVGAIAVSPGGDLVVGTGYHGLGIVWDSASGKPLVELHGHGSAIMSATFSPDGKRILTASWDATVRLWQTGTGHELLTLRIPPTETYEVLDLCRMSDDGHRIIAMSSNFSVSKYGDVRKVHVWEAATDQQIVKWIQEEALAIGP